MGAGFLGHRDGLALNTTRSAVAPALQLAAQAQPAASLEALVHSVTE
jgi:hypothetical protein